MISIHDIITKLVPHQFTGDEKQLIEKVVELGIINNSKNALSWCNKKNIATLESIESGTLIVPVLENGSHKKNTVNYIEVENPRHYFLQVLRSFFDNSNKSAGIAASAKINSTVKPGTNVFIGENVVIEEGTIIGNNCSIGHNTVIFRNTIIGNNVSIGCNCTIGGAGFGYEKNENGDYEMLPHIGNVVIENNVEIAHNVCIDRAVLSSTILHENVKVDNQVHIAHNVIVGKNSLIIANSMIGGSTVIGENVWVAPSASLINKITVDDNAVIGMGAIVIKPVAKNEVVAGNPAKPIVKK